MGEANKDWKLILDLWEEIQKSSTSREFSNSDNQFSKADLVPSLGVTSLDLSGRNFSK